MSGDNFEEQALDMVASADSMACQRDNSDMRVVAMCMWAVVLAILSVGREIRGLRSEWAKR